ncbi:MAG: FdtA/QdtA family cupin domain-containing protein [Muribaculaceae bacterium]|nr:FdtA/QdtA family cupin domain-containing protein [Muribaculaceae bacterium]
MNNHQISSLDNCRIVELPRIRHDNGSLTFFQNSADALFTVRRVFYLYDIPGDSERGGHSHHEAQELIVALSGCFDVVLNDGHQSRRFTLNRPYRGLYIPAGIWRELNNFSSGSVCLVLTSEKFDEEDYVREFDRFLELTAKKVTP